MTITEAGYQLRPFDPTRERDVSSLKEICANVYGGGDYLPSMAASYVEDPLCSFLALTDATTNAEILAVANYKRLPAQNSAWIEAVRTHPNHRNKGLASKLLHSIIDVSKKENDIHQNEQPTNILTCTIESNVGMKRALEKVGFIQTGSIPVLQFAKLKELPGWTPDCEKEAQPLLDALDMHHLVSPITKALASTSSWCTISTENDLLERLQQCKLEGCSGYLPGLYEYIVPGPNRSDLKQSMEQGLVLTLDVNNQKEISSCEQSNFDENVGQIILAFTQDDRISSLKSKWVCSIVAHTQIGFELALLHAHSYDVARRMHSFNDDSKCKKEHNNEDYVTALPFCLVFDNVVPIETGTLAYELPRVTDECIVFSYEQKE